MNLKVVALAAALASSGCSFALTRAPKPITQTGVPCNTSSAPAWIDTASVASNVLLAAAFSSSETERTDYGMSRMFVISGVASAVVYGISAAYGFSQVSACNRMRDSEMKYWELRPRGEWARPSQPAQPQQPVPTDPPFDVDVHTDVIITPRGN